MLPDGASRPTLATIRNDFLFDSYLPVISLLVEVRVARHRGLNIAIGVIVTVACLGVLLWRIDDPAKIRDSFQQADYRVLPVYWICLAAFYWLKSVRWAALLAPLRPADPLKGGEVLPALMTGFMGNNLLPAHLGEIIRVYVLGKRYDLPKAAIFATVLVERLCDVAAILAVLVWGLSQTPQASQTVRTAGLVAAAILAVTVVVLALFATCTAWFVRVTEAVLARVPLLPSTLQRKLCGMLETGALGMAAFRSSRLAVVIGITSLAQWLINAGMIFLSLYAFDIQQPLAVSAVVMAVVAFGVTVPSTPGFFGVIQACFAISLEPLGVSKADAFAASVFYHLSQYVPVTLIGLFFLNRMGLKLGQLEQVAKTTPAQQEVAMS